ncbi:hypothetical protein MACJ_002956 [Theileria orientalis]|uniref:BRCT domain-containing protein n=1 Tax=Theileria orientalis TaxID=68886 RepID=A0A976M8H4_THEOR|nr:hypothetical protein MACJ_002956 [Theileria orientalis]
MTALFFDDVYKSVYLKEEFWKNDAESGLWHNKTICFLGFDDQLDSCRDLVVYLLKSLITKGANIVKYPNKKVDVRKIPINFYLCNYSLGVEMKPPNSVDYKLVTPIWLYSCNRDNKIYSSDTLPIFRANNKFNCLQFGRSELKVSLIGSLNNVLCGTVTDMNEIKYSFDTLHRFIAHCGFSFIDYSQLKDPGFKYEGKLYLLFCKTLDESFEDGIIDATANFPCLSIQWLFDSYIAGEMKEIKNYLVSIQRYNTKSQLKKKKPMKRSFSSRVLCFSFGFAVENELNNVDLKEFEASAAYVVNPIYVLAPWALKTENQNIKKMYNNISLVEEKKLILFISKNESMKEAIGLFGELSLLIENSNANSGKNLVRNIRVYNSLNTTVSNYIEVPFELLDGKKLNLFERNPNVNLYDLADSITFMDMEDLSQYKEEPTMSQNTQELHEM